MAQFVVSKNSAILRDAIGALWMTIAGTVAALGVVAMSSTSVLEVLVLLLIVLVVSFALYPSIISTLRAALRLPRESSPAITAARTKVTRRFGAVFSLECLCFLLANIVLLLLHHYEYLVPAILLIVGIHFFPIAALFKMWPYYLTGLLFSLAAIITVLTSPYTLSIGHVSRWIVLPTAICAGVAWLTAACVLIIERRRLGYCLQVKVLSHMSSTRISAARGGKGSVAAYTPYFHEPCAPTHGCRYAMRLMRLCNMAAVRLA